MYSIQIHERNRRDMHMKNEQTKEERMEKKIHIEFIFAVQGKIEKEEEERARWFDGRSGTRRIESNSINRGQVTQAFLVLKSIRLHAVVLIA